LALKNLSPADGGYAKAREQVTRLEKMKVRVHNWVSNFEFLVSSLA